MPNELNDFAVILGESEIAGQLSLYSGTISKWNNYGYGLKFTAGYELGCCGAGSMENLTQRIGLDQKQLENYVSCMIRGMGFETTRYFIVADYQIQENVQWYPTDLIDLLLDLGAKQIDNTLNQNHGPSHMYLHIWAPNLNKDKIGKYINLETLEPLWWDKLSSDERIVLIEQSQKLINDRILKIENLEKSKQIIKERTDKVKALDWIAQNQDVLKTLGWTKTETKQNEFIPFSDANLSQAVFVPHQNAV